MDVDMTQIEQPPAQKPRLIIEYDPATMACSWQIPEMPVMPLVHALELVKTMLLNQQITEMVRQRQEAQKPRLVVPTLVHPTGKGS